MIYQLQYVELGYMKYNKHKLGYIEYNKHKTRLFEI